MRACARACVRAWQAWVRGGGAHTRISKTTTASECSRILLHCVRAVHRILPRWCGRLIFFLGCGVHVRRSHLDGPQAETNFARGAALLLLLLSAAGGVTGAAANQAMLSICLMAKRKVLEKYGKLLQRGIELQGHDAVIARFTLTVVPTDATAVTLTAAATFVATTATAACTSATTIATAATVSTTAATVSIATTTL